MAGTRFHTEIQGLQKIDAVFSRLSEGGRDLTPLMDTVAGVMVQGILRRFETETDPEGQSWKPSIRVEKKGGQTLTDSEELRNSFDGYAEANRAIAGTNLVKARIHQEGGIIKAKNGKSLAFEIAGVPVLVRQVTIPARPFLGFDDEDRAEILNQGKLYLQGLTA